MLWVLLQDVIARAGSFDDVLPHLESGRIMARATDFYTLGNERKERADNQIPPRWWKWQLRKTEPAAGRVWFNMELGDRIADELLQRARYPGLDFYGHLVDHVLLAIGIELERGAVEELWPKAVTPIEASWPRVIIPAEVSPTPKHAGGRPTLEWEAAARHVDSCIAVHGPLVGDEEDEPALKRAVELMTEGFERSSRSAPDGPNIYRWIREHPERCEKWWSPRRRRRS
jgi:hypothetical protein